MQYDEYLYLPKEMSFSEAKIQCTWYKLLSIVAASLCFCILYYLFLFFTHFATCIVLRRENMFTKSIHFRPSGEIICDKLSPISFPFFTPLLYLTPYISPYGKIFFILIYHWIYMSTWKLKESHVCLRSAFDQRWVTIMLPGQSY